VILVGLSAMEPAIRWPGQIEAAAVRPRSSQFQPRAAGAGSAQGIRGYGKL